MAKRPTRAESTQRTRRRLLEAGRNVFAADGFHAVTVEDVVTAAGFTRGAFYTHFADKDDFFATLIEERNEEALTQLEQDVGASPDTRLATAQAWLEEMGGAGGLSHATAEFIPYAASKPHLRDRMVARSRRFRQAITHMVQELSDEAGITLPVPADQVAAIVIALGEGVAVLDNVDPEGTSPNLFATGVAYLWKGLGTRE